MMKTTPSGDVALDVLFDAEELKRLSDADLLEHADEYLLEAMALVLKEIDRRDNERDGFFPDIAGLRDGLLHAGFAIRRMRRKRPRPYVVEEGGGP